MNAKEKFTAKEIWKQRNSYHPNDLGRHYCEEVAKETALENTFVKGINPESVEDMRNALQNLYDVLLHDQNYCFSAAVLTAKSALEKSKL